MSQVTEQSVRFQTALASIKLIQASAVLDLTEDDFDFLTSNKVWIATDRSRARRCVEACVYGTLDFVGYPRFPAPVEFIAAVIAYYVHPVNIQTACLIMEGAEFTENIINGVERPVKAETSRQNTKDQVYAQNEMLAYQQKESTARVASIMENTNLSKQQQVSEIMRQMLTQAQTAGQYFTNDQIKEMTRKVSAEVDLVHQQTQNQRYGSSHIGATAKDISNVVTDAASGVVDIFHGIDKAVADTWNNFWKDGKADGIGSNLSRK